MTISTQDSKVNYQGNGQTTVFQIPFPFLENEQIYVQKKDAEGNLINYTYATDYTVTGAGEENGGSVTLNVAPEQGSTISIYRDVPLTQEVDYRENEIFPAETHEEALDKLTMEVQQLQEQLDRSIKVDRFSDVDLDIFVNEIERVYDSTDNIDIVANNINDVNTVSGNIANVNTVAGDIDSVVTTATNINDVKTVAQNKASLNITAANINDIKTVSSIKDDVHTVADNNTNITTVAGSISSVNTAATNIEAIQDAPNQANSAKNSATQAIQSATSAAQSAQTAEDKADEASESARQALSALSLQIGDVCFVPLGIDESLNLRRYLNGQVIIQSQFVAFTNKVKSAIALYPNLATTEANWQAEKTNSKLGQCGKFVIDDTAGTIRLPCVVNAQGLVDLALIGGIKSESLPNITGSITGTTYRGANGAFSQTATSGWSGTSSYTGPSDFDFNASRSSSTYQNNAPVQQEAVQYPYCIIVNTGVEETDHPINNYQVNNVYSYGMSQYYKGTMNNNSWLKSAGQWNDGTVYTGMYNWLLEQMNAGVSGFVTSTATYTDYDFVINTTDRTFRLPLIAERVLVAKKEPTDGDYTWYNLYSDGWLEQGGYVYQAGGDTGVVSTTTFPKAFKNNDYAITMSAGVGNSGWQYANGVGLGTGGAGANERETHMTPTTFTWFNAAGAVGVPIFWEAKGYAEVPTEAEYTEVKGLYYYIGDTLQNAQLINVARIEETLVDKADTDLSNCTKPYVTETYRNGTEWYRLWSDGWKEQGSMSTVINGTAGVSFVVNYLTPFSSSDNQMIIMTPFETDTNDTGSNLTIIGRAANNFTGVNVGYGRNPLYISWYACGY